MINRNFLLSDAKMTALAQVREGYRPVHLRRDIKALGERGRAALEQEVFLSLCGEPKTQERIRYMLAEGNPLRRVVMQEAVIVSAVRTAVGKAPRGTLSQTRPETGSSPFP